MNANPENTPMMMHTTLNQLRGLRLDTLALSLRTCKYTHIRDILLNRRDLLQTCTAPEWTSPAHAHVRGAHYYQ